MTDIRRNAVIMAAGTSSRFVPLSSEYPKGLLVVNGEVLIERQICQLKEAGIDDITIVVGYKSDAFSYLKEKFGVDIVVNDDFDRYNNSSSLIRVVDRLCNTFICSSDNYFPENVFLYQSPGSYYSALYAAGKTNEYCLGVDSDDVITDVSIGGEDSWYMVGHVYFSEDFSRQFADILKREYDNEQVRLGYWEDVYIRFLSALPKMKIRRYEDAQIYEFDTLDELRNFDETYINDTRSQIVKYIAKSLNCSESDLSGFRKVTHSGKRLQFTFLKGQKEYQYNDSDKSIAEL